MADGKIYITISDERGGGGNARSTIEAVSNSGESRTEKSSNNVLGHFAYHKVENLIKQNAMTYLNYSVNNIGNFTGDYLTQRNIQATTSNAFKIGGYVSSAIAGAKIGGVPGAIIGVGVQAVSDIFSFNLQEKSAYVANRRINENLSRLRALSGLDGLNDGGRGTLS